MRKSSISKRRAVELILRAYTNAPEYLFEQIISSVGYKQSTALLAPALMKMKAKHLEKILKEDMYNEDTNFYVRTT